MARANPSLPKGQQTRVAIVQSALQLASSLGLEGLSIGAIAEAMGMSKSGVFAHFGSREELQIAVVRAYHERFEAAVFAPALAQPRGLPRLQALMDGWMRQASLEIEAGCLYISGAVEFDDRPGPVRDALADMASIWQQAVERAVQMALDMGHLHAPTGRDHAAEQLAFELHGIILALHYDARFLRRPGALGRAQQAIVDWVARYAHPIR